MPWVTDNNGEKKYNASLYSKDELPTFHEMYFRFYLTKTFSCDINTTVFDPYWKIPVDKFILVTACNQLNKMIFEDGFDKDLKSVNKEYDDFRFILSDGNLTTKDYTEKFFGGTKTPPPIYTIPLPNGNLSQYITNDHPRIRTDEMTSDKYQLKLMLDGMRTVLPNHEKFTSVLKIMMSNYEDYFNNLQKEVKKLVNEEYGIGCITGKDPAK